MILEDDSKRVRNPNFQKTGKWTTYSEAEPKAQSYFEIYADSDRVTLSVLNKSKDIDYDCKKPKN